MNKQQILYARVKEDVDTEKNTYIPDIYARSNFLLRILLSFITHVRYANR